jgi:hypothetical protein
MFGADDRCNRRVPAISANHDCGSIDVRRSGCGPAPDSDDASTLGDQAINPETFPQLDSGFDGRVDEKLVEDSDVGNMMVACQAAAVCR